MNKNISAEEKREHINNISQASKTHLEDGIVDLLCPLSHIRQKDINYGDICELCFAYFKNINNEFDCIIIENNDKFNYSLKDFKAAALYCLDELENIDE